MKARAVLSLAWLAASPAGVSACGDDPAGGAPAIAAGNTCPADSTLTYETFGEAFFQTHCLACHGSKGPESPKFDTVDQIRIHSNVIDEQAAAGPGGVNTKMPEGGSVAEAERRRLGEWLACGAP